jgi:hypothetical protein
LNWFEVIEEKQEYFIPFEGEYASACEKFRIEENSYSSLKIGYIGELVFEFPNPIGVQLAIFKVAGHDDYYRCILKSAIKRIDQSNISPFIVWIYLPSEVKKDVVTINGKVVALQNTKVDVVYGNQNFEIQNGNEINLEVNTSSGLNKSEIILKEDGLRHRNYSIIIRNIKRLNKQMNTDQIITKLDELEYFKYLTPETKNKFKDLLIEQLETGWLNMPNQYYFNDNKNQTNEAKLPSSIDRRSIDVDGSHIFRGGLEGMLKEFKYIFESRNLQFEISHNQENYSGFENEHLKHSVTINDTDYIIFNGIPERGQSEMDYLKTVFNLLNEELQKQNYIEEAFTVITSIETLYFLLIDIKTKEFIESLGNSIQNKVIDLNSF